jgi:hypothetical protein
MDATPKRDSALLPDDLGSRRSLGALDFPPDRTALSIQEVARKLSVSHTHIENLIDTGALRVVNLANRFPVGKRSTRRITIDSYRAFIRARME